MGESRRSEAVFHIAGWVLFILCAVLFLFTALRDGDGVLALASLIFLAACILFLIPLMRPRRVGPEATRKAEGGSGTET